MFRIQALPTERFAAQFALDDAALHARGARRVVVDACPGFPCRVSLQDALPGETVVLLHHLHHDVDSLYRASGTVFVRQAARAEPETDVVPGTELESAIGNLFEDPQIAYLHLHHARAGCYAALVTRS